MTIAADTWAIVLATATGPIAAILITFWRERRASIRARRLEIFRTLMATRRIPISAQHVNSLNLIEVDFYGCANVQTEWLAYKGHLFADAVEDDAWREKKERLLANLLCQMAKTLRYNIPAMDIFKGGYAPKGWGHSQGRLLEALEYVHDLAVNNKAIPMWLHGTTQHPAPPPKSTLNDEAPTTQTLPPTSLPPIE
jgi:hypothetical protein